VARADDEHIELFGDAWCGGLCGSAHSRQEDNIFHFSCWFDDATQLRRRALHRTAAKPSMVAAKEQLTYASHHWNSGV
jgi:hypothetical protein